MRCKNCQEVFAFPDYVKFRVTDWDVPESAKSSARSGRNYFVGFTPVCPFCRTPMYHGDLDNYPAEEGEGDV